MFRTPGLPPPKVAATKRLLAEIGISADGLSTEICYNVSVPVGKTAEAVFEDERVAWLFRETFEPEQYGTSTFINEAPAGKHGFMIELGPRLNFSTVR